MSTAIVIVQSALKHGCRPEDILVAWELFSKEFNLVEDPRKVLRVGFDRSARLLEVVGVWRDTGEVAIIHAMPARKRYQRSRKERRR